VWGSAVGARLRVCACCRLLKQLLAALWSVTEFKTQRHQNVFLNALVHVSLSKKAGVEPEVTALRLQLSLLFH
jgi:hypothetical protein